MTTPKKRRARWWIAAAIATAATTGTIIANDPDPVFEDNFDGSTLSGMWTVQRSATSGAKPDKACWDNYPDTIRVSDGTLKLSNVQVPPFTCQSPYGAFTSRYKGASISTRSTFEFTYGRVEVRAKFPTARVPGIHSAIWLYPRTTRYGPWPKSGEIDVAEYYTRYPDRAIPYLHYDPAVKATNIRCLIDDPTAWHTYQLDWRPSHITISYDDKVCLTHKVGKPFDQPFYLILTQTLGIGQNPFTEGTTPLPQTMEVDRVRVWKETA